MSANLYGERFSGRKPGWHELGTVKPEGWTNAVAAFKETRLDYETKLLPLVALLPGKKGHSTQLEIPNRMAIVREPNNGDDSWAYLGTASPDYPIIQNMDLAKLVDDLGLPSQWPIETVGAIGQGETIFLVLRSGTSEVAGEEIREYFTITDTRDAHTSMKFLFTPVCTVCENTLISAIGSATQLNKAYHTHGLSVAAEDQIKLMAGLNQTSSEVVSLFERLANTKITPDQTRQVIEAAYPNPTMPAKLIAVNSLPADDLFAQVSLAGSWSEESVGKVQFNYNREVARVQKVREEAVERLFRQNDERPRLAGTAFGVYQAVVECEDFRSGPKSLYASSIWGARAQTKVTALNTVVEMFK